MAHHAGDSTALLVAAVLVLVATQLLGPARESVPAVSGRLIARRALLFVIDYVFVVQSFTITIAMTEWSQKTMHHGVLNWFDLSEVGHDPARLSLLPLLVLYALAWRRFTRRGRSGGRAAVGHVVRAHDEARLR